MQTFRKLSLTLFFVGFFIVLVVLVWNFINGSEETWVLYSVNESTIIIESTHSSLEECSSNQNRNSNSVLGCRRVDGPYKILNKIADLAF